MSFCCQFGEAKLAQIATRAALSLCRPRTAVLSPLPWAPQEDWLEKASGVVTERIGRYAAHEIKFNLMAVVK